MLTLGKRWLPEPQVLHPFPDVRFAVNLQDKNRMLRSARPALCGRYRVKRYPYGDRHLPAKVSPGSCRILGKIKVWRVVTACGKTFDECQARIP